MVLPSRSTSSIAVRLARIVITWPFASSRATDDVAMSRYQTTSPPLSMITTNAALPSLLRAPKSVKPGSTTPAAATWTSRRGRVDAPAVGGDRRDRDVVVASRLEADDRVGVGRRRRLRRDGERVRAAV